MAKGQKRSSREVRKPKSKKPAAAGPAVAFLNKASTTPPGASKKKA